MKTIKFVRTGNQIEWTGYGGTWSDDRKETFRDDIADRLLNLYQSPFVEVKAVSPESDKMVRGAAETKEVDVKKIGKPTGDNKKAGKFGKGWGKNRGGK